MILLKFRSGFSCGPRSPVLAQQVLQPGRDLLSNSPPLWPHNNHPSDSAKQRLMNPHVNSPFLKTRVLEELSEPPPWYSVVF